MRRRRIVGRCCLLLGWLCAGLAPSARAEGFFDRPGGQGLMSLIIPGAGQFYQDNLGDAGLHFGLFGGSLLAMRHYQDSGNVLDENERFDDQREIQFYNRDTLRYDFFGLLATDTAFYSSYAAYRDARLKLGNEGYLTPAPKETFNELVMAPFRWEYLKRPTTFLPLLLVAAATANYRSGDPDDGLYEIRYADDVDRNELALFSTVGIGMGPAVSEEAFFRGFLNNQFSHSYGRWTGLALSTLTFALGHAGDGNQAGFGSAAVAGGYLGWLQQRNDYAIGEGVAIHFWTNFLVGLAALEQGGAAPNLVSFAYRF